MTQFFAARPTVLALAFAAGLAAVPAVAQTTLAPQGAAAQTAPQTGVAIPVAGPSAAIPATGGVQPVKLNPAQREVLGTINKYFNSIRMMYGDFVQFGPDGERSEGQFFMERPGKIRFIYAKPSTLDIVSDGTDVVVRDRKNQTQDLYPLSKTPLRFLLSDQIDLTTEANVTRVGIEPDLVSIVLEQSTVFGDGHLTLIFDRKSSELKQWTVTDAQNYDTSVAIYNVKQNQPIDPITFKYDRLAPALQRK
ncbi:outer-membrane lipoprotein carrier protein LolA [Methyloraptor flagellatus]|jgi:outer membrane lipoprotein-sorting protein|uniref:Outer-membrane lipoprotein carrier protein LolA n=1 Tax=Methyloraptor flagellatus TaxID=3162530 RepID=A0AAU7X819_9HYPH